MKTVDLTVTYTCDVSDDVSVGSIPSDWKIITVKSPGPLNFTKRIYLSAATVNSADPTVIASIVDLLK